MWERKRAAMGMDRKVQVEEWLEGKLKEVKKVYVTLKGPSVPSVPSLTAVYHRS